MKSEWDKNKAWSNLRKHGVDFADAAIALEDENALTIEDKDFSERRYKTLALEPNLEVLLIIHTASQPEVVRLISARRADAKERRQYFKGINHE